jgi:hypothetical protein
VCDELVNSTVLSQVGSGGSSVIGGVVLCKREKDASGLPNAIAYWRSRSDSPL